jgi:folate-dependent phosphoribosylglycinamide formyltransferase PurN
MVKVLIITGNQLRHQYYVTHISKFLDVVGVIYEEKIIQENKFKEIPEQFDIASQHFQNRNISEEKYFAGKIKVDHIPSIHVKTGASNSKETFTWVQKKQPEYLLLFGSSIIKDPLLGYFNNKVINMHLGLSPYYRGAGTNFWPLVNNEPECVGATIHLATLKVDAGSILKQVRPDVDPQDGPHDLGNKTIIRAIEKIPSIVTDYDNGSLTPQGQDLSIGKVYRRKDLTPDSITRLYENFECDMISDFIQNKEDRLRRYPIVD